MNLKQEAKIAKTFRSLEEIHRVYFPSLTERTKTQVAAPRAVGARLAREALAQVSGKAEASRKKRGKGKQTS